jgi:hypothetical protein
MIQKTSGDFGFSLLVLDDQPQNLQMAVLRTAQHGRYARARDIHKH